MSVVHKLFLLAATAATALALIAASASAQLVATEVPTGSSCGTATIGSNHTVTGGCHIEFTSTGNGVPMHAYIPAKTTIASCTWNLEGSVGSNGEGYFVLMALTAPSGGSVPCTRTACDEANGTQIPWHYHMVEHGPDNEELELAFCLRPISNPAGSAGSQCEIHYELTEVGFHLYAISHPDIDNGIEVFCENNPPNTTGHPSLPFPVSFEPHLVTSGTERIEIHH